MSAIIGTAIGGLLLSVASKVGAKALNKVIEGEDGGLVGFVVSKIVDKIGAKLGRTVEPAELPDLPPKEVEAAVAAVEVDLPAILAEWNEQQRNAIDMQRTEMEKSDKEATWTWAWRPAGMWLFNLLVLWYAAIVPVINMVAMARGWGGHLELTLDVASFVAVYMFFAGLYMGGHTAKDFFTKAAGALGQWRGSAGR